MTYREALTAILTCPKSNGYAKSYARAGLHFTDPYLQKTQIRYILNNIQHWRGERAKETREALKAILAA